jgi:hypothetical protein
LLRKALMRLRTWAVAFLGLLPGPAATGAPGKSAEMPWCATGARRAQNALLAHREAEARGVRAAAAGSVSADVGQIAVLQDEGELALLRHLVDLQGAGVRFTPSGSGYTATRMTLPFEPDTGTVLTLGDDDSSAASLPFAFPFYGRSYSSLYVNSDGNLSFGAGDSASTSRDVGRLVGGPPRAAPLLADLNLETGGRLSILATSDHATVTWNQVPQYGMTDKNTFQVTLWADGRVDFVYGNGLNSAITEAAVGIAPGGGQGGLTAVDFATATGASGAGALVESFRSDDALDTVAVAHKFYLSHGDDYQQLVVFTSRSLIESGAFSYELTVKNQDAGIGADVQDLSGAYGSAGRLESFVDMDSIGKYPDDINLRFLGEDSSLTVLGHEVGHRWLAQARFMDGGRVSDELLGRDLVHWSFFTDTDGSYLEGNDIADLGGGSFRTAGASLRYSALDQYLMGLRPAEEVPSFFFVRSPAGTTTDPGRAPRTGVSFTGTRKDVSIGDVVAALGPRNPAAAPSSTPFRQAFIYVVVGGGAPDAAALAHIERIRAAWPAFFSQSVEGRGSVDPRLN